MATSKNDDLSIELAKSLEAATTLMQDLLKDIKDNATSLAVLNIKLESLGDNVEALSHIVRDGNGDGSMVTRLALAEKSLEDVEESFDALRVGVDAAVKELKDAIKQEREDKEIFNKKESLAKLKLFAVVAPGVIALAIVVIKLLMGETAG